MLKWINNILEQKQKQQELDAETKRQMQAQARKERVEELIDLRLITINNVRYLRSYINTLRSVSNTMKGETAGETRKKRAAARSQIKWLETKLKEEQAMEIYWDEQIEEEGILIT